MQGKFFHSLRWKVAIFLITLVLGTVLLTGWVINRTLDRQFKKYLINSHQEEIKDLLNNLSEAYINGNGWHNLTNTVVGRHWLINTPIIKLEDAQGHTIFIRSIRQMRFHRSLNNRKTTAYPISANGRIVGKAWILGTNPAGLLTQTDLAFEKAVNYATLISSVLLGLSALFLGFLGVRTYTTRLNHLQRAVSSLAKGNLTARVQDISHDELGVLSENFNKMADKLLQLEELRKKYLTETAHELRTPLTTIRSHIEAFIDGIIPPEQEALLRVQEEVMNLVSLLNDLQDLVSTTGLRNNLTPAPLNLNDFLKNLTDKFRPVAAGQGISIDLNLCVCPAIINTDSGALTKIINNLLMNAIKFSSPGKRVSVALNKTGSGVKISVADQGIGIHPEDLPKIFDRFYRVDPSRSRKTGGTGLGLAIVKELTAELGGRVEVTSRPHQGSTFTLTFPLLIH